MNKKEKKATQRKNNKSVKIAVILFGAVLITTSLLGGTLAKYVSDLGTVEDTGRVAKWDVTGKLATYTLFSEAYKGDAEGSTTKDTVKTSVVGEKVFAPGTKGTVVLAPSITSTNTEVAYKVKYVLEDGSGYVGDFKIDDTTAYYPLRFKLVDGKGVDVYNGIDGTNTADPGEKQAAKLLEVLSAAESDVIYPGDTFDTSNGKNGEKLKYTLSWEWPFEVAGNDEKDTALGKKAVSGNLNFVLKLQTQAVQVD